ncbi:ATP-binding protein [Streptomyces sp. JB150]|uniref:sensor histidine kinase n=1 Tax=Streptomyces sp. JB150 TaxID=2714844 RepID=UPI00140BFCEA|nr:ATP-binding protein [Streptomyces sp. JB150]QIJ60715.1 sensor histidine kinase [Streptomyces sp. JB150]
MTAPSPPGERSGLRTVLPPALAAAVPTMTLVAGTAVTIVPPDARLLFASGGGTLAVLLGAAVAVAARYRITSRVLRGKLDDAGGDIGRLLQDKTRMQAEFARELERLAQEAERERHVLADDLEHLRGDNARLAERVRQAETERATAISATANAAARLQALANGILADLRAMEEKHSDEEVLDDLLHLDHRTAQAGRVADSIAVLSGARSGRRWARPIPMESILRGAMGRIGGYRRVRVHSTSETAVAGHAAEGVMHVLAELLDNATNFSPPTSEVHVYVEEVPAGVLVSVEDSGLVMSDVQLRRAERAVSGDITGLGGLTGTRLGLAVVGRLSRKHGLKVSFRPSARGGTGVLVLLPQEILTVADTRPSATEGAAGSASDTAASASERTASRAALPASRGAASGAPAASPASTASAGPEQDAAPGGVRTTGGTDASGAGATAADPDRSAASHTTAGGLPRRRRGHTLAAAERSRTQLTRPGQSSQPDRTSAAPTDIRTRTARFTSFRQAVRGEAPRPGPDGGPNPAPPPAQESGSDTPTA